eukprot:scaffold4078_cov68-Phaeocystis_antarctica.AAC.8
MAMLQARTSSPSRQGDSTRKSNWSKKEPSCRQLSGRPNASMLRFRTSKTSSNEATDAGIATLKTLSTRVAICARRANLQQGSIGHFAQALAWLAQAAPTEKEHRGQGDASEGCQRSCRCVPALHARRLTRVKLPRAIGDVADSAIWSSGPWLAGHAIHVRARRRVGRGRIGAAPQIRAVIVCAPVSGQQGKQSHSFPRPLAVGPDRAATTLDVSWVVDGHAGTLISLARKVVESVLGAADVNASRAPRSCWTYITFLGVLQTWETTDGASFAGGGCGASGRAKEVVGAQGRLGRCVFWAVIASRATTSASSGELAINIVCLGATEPRRARLWPIRLVITSWEELFQGQP